MFEAKIFIHIFQILIMNFKSISKASLLLLALSAGLISCDKEDDKQTETFNYSFNTSGIAPYTGTHATTLSAELTVTESDDDKSMVMITLNDAIKDETYMVHAHDKADATSTPNGTPYLETPNSNVLAGMIATTSTTGSYEQESSMSFTDLTTTYDGFLVVHDPLQPVNTADPSTYVILGDFARN